MPDRHSADRRADRTAARTSASRAATVARLGQVPRLSDSSLRGCRAVMAIRLLAICSHAERDPLVELTRRFGSVTAARLFVEFSQALATCWPEPVRVMRPCCPLLSADESAVAVMAEHAGAGDRKGFAAVIDGLVRPDRHDRLFDTAVAAMAAIH